MNKDQVKGVAQKVKGKLNETVGKATGNKSQELKGDLQQVGGGLRQSYGDAKARIKRSIG
ncbi:CsbD family protein [Paraburkholderia sp. DHOC27]|uniref:CsbD family protein n=1 Tax=Paraburkholderia sp. DHOC27 TaxID=2303330 RepID=UPI000E3DBDB2|nr:CsbD family protein [Paraburkholderia sp. DHOC27]RFU45095.1 CsbD family protein [Paraburkholderia sp. DHOC27]